MTLVGPAAGERRGEGKGKDEGEAEQEADADIVEQEVASNRFNQQVEHLPVDKRERIAEQQDGCDDPRIAPVAAIYGRLGYIGRCRHGEIDRKSKRLNSSN